MKGDWDSFTWPKAFQTFLIDNEISPDIYEKEQSRFIYVLDVDYCKSTDLFLEFPDATLENSRPNFYRLLPDTNVVCSKSYKTGAILPIDPSSVLAVDNLDLQVGEHVLDLCCAPGAKLVLIAKRVASTGSVTGIDISRSRLGATMTMAKKFRLFNARLFLDNGAAFEVPVHRILPRHETTASSGIKAIYKQYKNPLWSSSSFRKERGELSGYYDKVLVDAQCTHDGSVKHVRKQVLSNWKYFEPRQYSLEGLQELYELQHSLLENGFKMLKKGGLLVYSTCSLSKHQNQRIVEKFMDVHLEDASIEDPVGIDEALIVELANGKGRAASIKPSMDSGGGFFICRIRRNKN